MNDTERKKARKVMNTAKKISRKRTGRADRVKEMKEQMNKIDGKAVYSVATGVVDMKRKASRNAAKYIASLEGFIALHPAYPRGILWLFDSENNAKSARNMMEAKGIQCGKNICKGTIEGDTLVME